MTNQTQLQWIKDRLKEDGCVSRNGALKNYISRLSARIMDLRRDGWKITGDWVKTEQGKDYVYRLMTTITDRIPYGYTELMENFNKLK